MEEEEVQKMVESDEVSSLKVFEDFPCGFRIKKRWKRYKDIRIYMKA